MIIIAIVLFIMAALQLAVIFRLPGRIDKPAKTVTASDASLQMFFGLVFTVAEVLGALIVWNLATS